MLEFSITNLLINETSFEVPSSLGKWKFSCNAQYADAISAMKRGLCANTFLASLNLSKELSSEMELETACDELIDICLMLSFLTARCVTPSGTTPHSDISFIKLPDCFLRSRSIVGFSTIQPLKFSHFFSDWHSLIAPVMKQRLLRLQLCHWLSGLTCFTLEDIYLSACIQMDIVKQVEMKKPGAKKLTYFKGMEIASKSFLLKPLNRDFKAMRDDLVHEGVLSGKNFASKGKGDCAKVIVEVYTWIDAYILAIIGKTTSVTGIPRWTMDDFKYGLPSVSLRNDIIP